MECAGPVWYEIYSSAGFISLNGTSVWSSPPSVPQLSLTRSEYEMTIPIASDGHLPSLISVDEARLTSSSFRWPSSAMPRRSLLLEASGTRKNDFVKLAPGVIGQPSRVSSEAMCLLNCAFTIVT
uniref:Uncharacterized protein n=1 Tax=Anopheles melas TaxID=34690 RepID=A0A182U6S8_9DIPT